MAYTITQARSLLTAAELELFDQSRAEPIKALTLVRLRGKVTRARTLRDKYRDLFRRQTVSVRTASTTKGRSPVGADNERTQRKADILQEVLGRFEDRVAQLETKEAKEERGGASLTKAPRTPPVATKRASRTRAAAPDKRPMPSKATQTAGATGPAKAAGSRKQASVPVAAAAAAPPLALSAGVAPPVGRSVKESVLNGHATRSAKAPSDKAPTANGKAHAPLAHAPTDMVPSALRGNPLKQAPSNIAIQAHQSGSMRRAQGKRDSR